MADDEFKIDMRQVQRLAEAIVHMLASERAEFAEAVAALGKVIATLIAQVGNGDPEFLSQGVEAVFEDMKSDVSTLAKHLGGNYVEH